MMLNDFLIEISRYLLICVFTVSAWNKLYAPVRFSESLQAGFEIPKTPSITLTLLIFIAEVACTIQLVSNIEFGSAIAATLLTIFTLAIGYTLLRGKVIYCQCFGTRAQAITPLDLIRNLIYIGAAIIILISPNTVNHIFSTTEISSLFFISLIIFILSTNLHSIYKLAQ